ncbi:hypothetical protein GCM10022225_74630 [Plantactinospora mayteni]|uniref:Uncharacterized protein n=1 Tax=Plantactinospora mayteni TaxID=566021 RepID=A0ABQ4EL25_9ACTN|nr:hypothetical protein [Plantactinospora mayteni]GIG95429.1 hypothetical protein Pma05_20020 [Plantactinospora mayteni]
MRLGDLLRQLDSRLLPPLARGMARLGHGRLRLRLLTTVALLCSVAVLVTAVWAADRRPAGDQTVGEVTRVGVVQGQSIPGYVEASRGELRALVAAGAAEPAQPTYALVTMSAYLAPDRLTPVLTGIGVSEVFARLWRPGTQTEIVRIPAQRVPDDVLAGMSEIAARKDQEVQDYQERAAGVTGDGARERELRQFYSSGARVADEEATAYRARCSCVYAAVVRGEPAALERVAARSEVRAVDPAPEVQRLDRTVFTPPLPEQHDVVRPPADASLPPAEGDGTGGPDTGREPGTDPAAPPNSTDPVAEPPVDPPVGVTAGPADPGATEPPPPVDSPPDELPPAPDPSADSPSAEIPSDRPPVEAPPADLPATGASGGA